jgi:DnaD/phage-associated family protein
MVSNLFIDEFLADANDCQIKVYLYLYRMFNAGKQTNISDIADKFNHTEKDVCRALRYWEKKGILSLDYDSNGGIVGIRLYDPAKARSSSEKKSPQLTIVSQPDSVGTGRLCAEPVRPNYTLDDLKAFKNRKETPQLIFIAEQYLKKTLSANDIRSILFYCDELNFSEELIDYLIQFCVSRGKSSFAYMDKVATDWADRGIDTVKKAREYTSSFDDTSSRASKSSSSRSAQGRKRQTSTMFHQFEQNDYDFNILEQKLLQN